MRKQNEMILLNEMREIETLEASMNLSEENISKLFHEKVAEEQKRQSLRRRHYRCAAAAAAAIMIGIAGIPFAFSAFTAKTPHTDIASYKDMNTFLLNVYADVPDSNPVILNENARVLLDKNARAKRLSINGSNASMIVELPLLCEGDDIETITYHFKDDATVMMHDYVFEGEDAKMLQAYVDEFHEHLDYVREHGGIVDNPNEESELKQWFHQYFKEHKLIQSYERSNDGPYHTIQEIGTSYTIDYDKQDEEKLYFRFTGHAKDFSVDDYTAMEEFLNAQVLLITAKKTDGSTSTRAFKFEFTNADDTFAPISIYAVN